MRIIDYAKENSGLLFMGVFFALFPGMVMALSEKKNFCSSNGFYSIIVSTSIFLIYLISDYIKKRKHYRLLLKLLGEEDLNFVLALPDEISSMEKLYQELLIQLKRNAEDQMETFRIKKDEDMEFVETWVHEIKTPISAVKLILEKCLEEPDEKSLYAISDEIEKIEDMVQKNICYSQLGDFSKDCQIRSINLQKVFYKCLKTEFINIHSKKIKVKMTNINFEVNSDEKWLYFILKQILDNAVKYSMENGSIEVYGVNELHNQRIIIEDHGIGIRKADIRRIFEKGYTGLNGRDRMAATGVGLYLSNKLAQKLGHEIKVESKKTKGTKAEIRLQK